MNEFTKVTRKEFSDLMVSTPCPVLVRQEWDRCEIRRTLIYTVGDRVIGKIDHLGQRYLQGATK